MAEEKKPKIDLKARLGKKTVTASGGPSIPPPVGIPKPSGVPVPPFGAGPSRPAAPRVDASDPYASISADAAPVRNEPQAIKVEMSEEVVAAQKKGRTRVIVLAVVTAIVGGGVGFAFGSGHERDKQAQAALAFAQDLIKKVDTANAEVTKLADTLKAAKAKLSDNKYPEAEVKALGAINVPFEGIELANGGIGRFPPRLIAQLIAFASGAHEANDGKDRIVGVLGGAKPAIEDFLSQQATPKVRWAVYMANGAYGPWAVMQPLPDPFLVKTDKKEKDKDGKEKAYTWPDTFKISDGGKKYDLKRYTSGNPMGSGDPKIIPVDPTSQGSVCQSDTLVKLRRELGDLEDTLRGDKTPGHEKDGVIDTGNALLESLKKIGTPSG